MSKGIVMAQTVDEAFSQMSLYSDEVLYVLIKLPANAVMAAAGVVAEWREAFCCLIIDKDEVTLLLPERAFETFAERLPGHLVAKVRYRLITFDIPLDLSMIGFMARVSSALAEANVSILPYAAYTRDHIFVHADAFDAAWTTLQQLQNI